MSGQPRLVDLAELVGVEYPVLRGRLAREVDAAVRMRLRSETARARALFNGDADHVEAVLPHEPGKPPRRRLSGDVGACPNGHLYREADVDRLGRRRCSRCRPRKVA